MFKKSISKRILPGLTGRNFSQVRDKIAEAEKYKLKKVALFLEMIKKNDRKKIYSILLSSKIKKIPFCHIRDDMTRQELTFLRKNFKTKYFNIHEGSFKILNKWKGFEKRLLLELNYDDKVPKTNDLKKIRGFCIDLSHFKSSHERYVQDFVYVFNNRKHKKLFIANHLNGYSVRGKRDLHTVKSVKELDYLKTLPKFVFGKYIALEMFNPIREQLKFKKYIAKILKNKL